MFDKKEGMRVPGGGRKGETCDHGLVQKVADGKTSYTLS